MITEAALLCLALNLYHEARGEPIEGQIAVNLVVLNRVKRNGTSHCHEVFRPHQFSWTTKRPLAHKRALLNRLKGVVKVSIGMHDFTGGATHYHSTSVHPEWANSLIFVGRWGNHLFYKEK